MSGFEDDNYDLINNPHMDWDTRQPESTTTSHQSASTNHENTSPLRSEISTVLVSLQNLYNTASFLSTLGGDVISHTRHVKLLSPINDLLKEVTSVDQALKLMDEGNDGSYKSLEDDIVYDKDILFKWTSDCNTCILGFQAKLEEEAQRLTDWMESQPQKEKSDIADEDEDEEWTVLEKDDIGNVHSVSLREKKQTENLNESTTEDDQTQTFKVDPNWELESYAQQLTLTMHDLGTCVPFVRRFAPTTWTRHGNRRGRRGNSRLQNQGEDSSWLSRDY